MGHVAWESVCDVVHNNAIRIEELNNRGYGYGYRNALHNNFELVQLIGTVSYA